MIYVGDRFQGNQRKLQPNWRSGYRVTDITNGGSLVHMEEIADTAHTERYHISKVKQFRQRTAYHTTLQSNLVEPNHVDENDSDNDRSDHDEDDAKQPELEEHQYDDFDAPDPEINDSELDVHDITAQDSDAGHVYAPAINAPQMAAPIPLLSEKGNRLPKDAKDVIRDFDLTQFIDNSHLIPPQIES